MPSMVKIANLQENGKNHLNVASVRQHFYGFFMPSGFEL
jgi:hypothetical protein